MREQSLMATHYADVDSRTEIEKETGFKAELLSIDQSDFSSVVEFAQAFGDGPLDIAVLNAGIATRLTERTKDGWETTCARL